MRFDGTFGNKKLVGNFLVGQPFGNTNQHLVLPFTYPQLFYLLGINWVGGLPFMVQGPFVNVNSDNEKNNGHNGDSNFYGEVSRDVRVLAQLKKDK